MRIVRCMLAAFLLLVFAGGGAVFAAQASDSGSSHLQMSTSQPVPSNCNPCGGGDKLAMSTFCLSMGFCVQALQASNVSVDFETASVVYPVRLKTTSGVDSAPDPFPPRHFA